MASGGLFQSINVLPGLSQMVDLIGVNHGSNIFEVSLPSESDGLASNPRFIELQEQLRCVLIAGTTSRAPSKQPTPEPTSPDAEQSHQVAYDFSRVSIPTMKMVAYLQNWILECAPYLDKFDEARHFGIQVPLVAQQSPALLYTMLAFSARQIERKACDRQSRDSLELYQESIHLLAPGLQARDPNMLVAACILAVMELMSGSSRDWKRHLEGCASLFEFFDVHGFSGGLVGAVFWCYARMELCSAIISGGAQSTVLTLDRWVPSIPEGMSPGQPADDYIKGLFYQKTRKDADMHGNWAVYLCAKACDLIFRRTRSLELETTNHVLEMTFENEWNHLWGQLQFWVESRPTATHPVQVLEAGDDRPFPTILFGHWAAISGNQLYHTACIMMLEIRPCAQQLPEQRESIVWHAQRVCGISWTNPHRGNLINSIQPLYIASRHLTHFSQHLAVGRLLALIERSTGWGALWRLEDLEAEWGYQSGEIFRLL